jgi:hypothetical protein
MFKGRGSSDAAQQICHASVISAMHVPAKSERNKNDKSSFTFNALDALTTGKTLTVVDWASETSPNYALRFLGDDSTNATFLALIDGTTINGLDAIFRFDGTYTDVSAVPLPESYGMLISGLGLLGVLGYRRRRNAPRPLVAPAHQAVPCAF